MKVMVKWMKAATDGIGSGKIDSVDALVGRMRTGGSERD
jgi:hypothetical protein